MTRFREKPDGDGGRINGGFFVASPSVPGLVDGPGCIWERGPLETLAAARDLVAYRHDGFWPPLIRFVTSCSWRDCGPRGTRLEVMVRAHAVFDLDGTLIDSVPHCVEILNHVATADPRCAFRAKRPCPM